MTPRIEALRAYFREVVRDLAARGVIRRGKGQSLDEILKAELPLMAKEMQADLLLIAKELGQGIIQGAVTAGIRWLSGLGKTRLGE